MNYYDMMVLFCYHSLLSIISIVSIIEATTDHFSSDFLLDIDGSSVIAGQNHICVLEYKRGIDIGGKVRCWDGEIDESKWPPNELIFIQLSGGEMFNCGVTVEQTVFCWGHKDIQGQIPGLYRQISVSQSFGCGILTDGGINCWGYSSILPLITKQKNIQFVQISCSRNHCCALDKLAYPHCWGTMSNGEINPPLVNINKFSRMLQINEIFQYEKVHNHIGLNEDEFTSSNIVSENEEDSKDFEKLKFKQISVGFQYSCGITLEFDDLQCWGEHNSNIIKGYPKFIKGPFRQVSVGGLGLCVIRTEKIIETNDLDASNSISNQQVLLEKSSVSRILSDNENKSNRVECWGKAKKIMPAHSNNFEWDQISVGDGIICGVTMDSELKCWGRYRASVIPDTVIVA